MLATVYCFPDALSTLGDVPPRGLLCTTQQASRQRLGSCQRGYGGERGEAEIIEGSRSFTCSSRAAKSQEAQVFISH